MNTTTICVLMGFLAFGIACLWLSRTAPSRKDGFAPGDALCNTKDEE